jgi:molecular chaperone DnaK (HSP70)
MQTPDARASRRLVAHFAKLFEKKTGMSIKGDLQAVEKLRRASEDVKRQLSSQVRVGGCEGGWL